MKLAMSRLNTAFHEYNKTLYILPFWLIQHSLEYRIEKENQQWCSFTNEPHPMFRLQYGLMHVYLNVFQINALVIDCP